MAATKRPKRPKHKSRATRCGEATQDIANAMETVAEVVTMIRVKDNGEPVVITAAQREEIYTMMANAASQFDIGASEVMLLGEEMRNWVEQIQEHFSQTEKYERVSEAADTLENADSELQSVSWPTVPEASLAPDCDLCREYADMLEEIADTIENVVGELEGVEFPGMFG